MTALQSKRKFTGAKSVEHKRRRKRAGPVMMTAFTLVNKGKQYPYRSKKRGG